MRMFFVAVLCVPALLAADDTDPQNQVTVRVYSVADLVAAPDANGADHLRQMLLLETSNEGELIKSLTSGPDKERSAVEANMHELRELLQTTTVPEDWEDVGGRGRISTYQKTLSLVVRQHEKGHQEICELLEQLRRENDVKVFVTVEVLKDSHTTIGTQCQPMAIYGGATNSVNPYGFVPVAGSPSGTVPASYSQPPPPQARIPQQPAATALPAPALPQAATPTPSTPGDAYILREPQKPADGTATGQSATKPQFAVRAPAVKPEKPQSIDDIISEMRAKHGASMNADELKQFRLSVKDLAVSELRQSTTINNGHSALVGVSSTTTVISPDRRFVDVQFSMPFHGLGANSARIADGETSVFRLNTNGESMTVLLTAKIQVPKEAEEKVSVPTKK